jgi:membrane-associated phospholipid phosphatase
MYKQLLFFVLLICCFFWGAAQQRIIQKPLIADTSLSKKITFLKWQFNNISQKKTLFIKSTYVAVPLIVLGVYNNDDDGFINKYEVWEDRNEHIGNFKTRADDYLQFAPAAAVYAMNAFGIKGKHDAWNQTALLIKAELIMNAIVHPLKIFSYQLRPDSSGYSAFPSGHSAQAFLSAEFLRKEYGENYPLLAAGGYMLAISVGAMRILNNKHWVTDVMAGAGIGILSANLAYVTHKNKWPFLKKRVKVLPSYTGYSTGIYLNYAFGR